MSNVLKVVSLLPSKLEYYVHTKAKVGEILLSYDNETRRRLIYFCNKNNIGKDVKPSWIMINEYNLLETSLRNQFEHMTLEEKVDFLIDRHIENELYNLNNI